MTFVEHFQLNLYTLAMLITVFAAISVRIRIETYGKKIMQSVILVTMAAIVTEILTWELDGSPSEIGFIAEYGTNMVLLFFAPVLSALMLSYVRYQITGEQRPLLRQALLFPPTIITILALVFNIFVPIYFSVDATTHLYRPEPLLWLHYALMVSIYLYMMGYIIVNRNGISRRATQLFTIYFGLPLIGMFVQAVNVNVFFAWTAIALSILVVFLFLELADGETDYLTGLFNRRSFETFVGRLAERNEAFALLYLDLDDFKNINDQYGHDTGDFILKAFSDALRAEFVDSPMVSRLGGDEYMVVLRTLDPDVSLRITALQETLAASENELVAQLRFSYGDIRYEADMDIDQLYGEVDRRMYEYKRENKRLKRRKTDN